MSISQGLSILASPFTVKGIIKTHNKYQIREKTMQFYQVTSQHFKLTLQSIQNSNELIKNSTTPAMSIKHKVGNRYFLFGIPSCMGFCISDDGELTSVFSTLKGQGNRIMQEVINRSNGYLHLDCFDGYLPTFYSKHGFKEIRRELNWTPGGPDVVYMERF